LPSVGLRHPFGSQSVHQQDRRTGQWNERHSVGHSVLM